MGRMAEWFKALVLKTSRGFRSLVGSNPTPSASSRKEVKRRRTFAALLQSFASAGPCWSRLQRILADVIRAVGEFASARSADVCKCFPPHWLIEL